MADPRPSSEVAASGNFLVADEARLEGNFRCEGHARLGRAASVNGDLHVAGSLAVRENAIVTGALTCAGEVDWHPTARAGAIRADGAFKVGGHQLAAALDAPGGIGLWDAKEGEA